MTVEVETISIGIPVDESLQDYIRQRLCSTLGPAERLVGRIVVRLASNDGCDTIRNCCAMRLQLTTGGAVIGADVGPDLHSTIDSTAEKVAEKILTRNQPS